MNNQSPRARTSAAEPERPAPALEGSGFFSGQFVPANTIALPLDDLGLTHGVLVCDTLRTFSGKLLLLDRHLNRLRAGCQVLGFDFSEPEIGEGVQRIVEENLRRAGPEGDLRISLLATPGPASSRQPTMIATAAPLEFRDLHQAWSAGISLAVSATREIPDACIPRSLKHRNRIHYWQAEREASATAPGSRALLLDHAGRVSEATTAAIGIVTREGTFVAPPEDAILGSISLAVAIGFFEREGRPVRRQPLHLADLQQAREVLWFNALVGAAPVSQLIVGEAVPVQELAGRETGEQQPVKLFHDRSCHEFLMSRWREFSGTDLIAQAARNAGC